MFKNILILIVFLNWPFSIAAQNDRLLDSLIAVAEKETIDSVKVQVYFKIYRRTINSNPVVAKEYIYKCKKLLENNRKLSINDYFHSLIECSTANRILGSYNEALKFVNEAHHIADSLNNSKLTHEALDEKGLLLMNIGDFNEAKDCFLKIISIKKILNPNDSSIYGDYNNLAIIYAQTGQLPKAEEYFRGALQAAIKLKNLAGMGNGYNNVGVIKIMQGQLDSVLYYLEKGKELRKKINELYSLSGSYNNMALYYRELKKHPLALKFADTAFALAEKTKGKTEMIEVLDTYYHLYEDVGDYKNAFSYYRQKQELLKKIQDENIVKKISEYQSGFELQKKQEELNESRNELLLKDSREAQQKLKINLMLLVVLFLGIAVFLVLNRNKKISAANKIISQQKQQVEEQKEIIEEKHKDITDSINYAQKIQTALIISERNLSVKVDNIFVMFQPRDIVSGDFYWFGEKSGYKLLAVADCTGHGVPGAFMSMIGITLLNQIVNEKGVISPSEILNKLREGIIASLNPTGDVSGKRDGMDVAIIAWNKSELIYAGANNPCVVIKDNELLELKPDKQPVGLYETQNKFTERKIEMAGIDNVFLFTDGIVDQFGGNNGKKLKMKLFKEWLSEIAKLDSVQQKTELNKKFSEWKGEIEQTDDILVIGIKK